MIQFYKNKDVFTKTQEIEKILISSIVKRKILISERLLKTERIWYLPSLEK